MVNSYLNFFRTTVLALTCILGCLNARGEFTNNLKNICVRLEGTKLCAEAPKCTANVTSILANICANASVNICGTSYTGTAEDTPCADPSTYTKYETRLTKCDNLCPEGTKPTAACRDPGQYSHCVTEVDGAGKLCPVGTGPVSLVCTGSCYSAIYSPHSYSTMVTPERYCKDGIWTLPSDCTTTTNESGIVVTNCTTPSYCVEWIYPAPSCQSSSETLVTGSTKVDNVLNAGGCGCTCGLNGNNEPILGTPTPNDSGCP